MSKRDEWIDGMMAEGRPSFEQTTFRQRHDLKPRWHHKLIVPAAIVSILFCLAIGVYYWTLHPIAGMVGFAFAIFPILVIRWWLRGQATLMGIEEQDYRDALAHHRLTQQTSLSQRPELVAALTAVEIEKYRAQGALDVSQLEYLRDMGRIQLDQAEAARVRQFEAEQATLTRQHETNQTQSSYQFQQAEASKDRSFKAAESARDRQQALEILITRFEGDINKLRAQMELARPDAYVQMEQEMITLEGKMKQLQKINDLPNKTPQEQTLRKQLFDQFKRQWKV